MTYGTQELAGLVCSKTGGLTGDDGALVWRVGDGGSDLNRLHDAVGVVAHLQGTRSL